MIRVQLVENNIDYRQQVTYKFDIDESNEIYDDWRNVDSVDQVVSSIRVWHCGEIVNISKPNIVSLKSDFISEEI